MSSKCKVVILSKDFSNTCGTGFTYLNFLHTYCPLKFSKSARHYFNNLIRVKMKEHTLSGRGSIYMKEVLFYRCLKTKIEVGLIEGATVLRMRRR